MEERLSPDGNTTFVILGNRIRLSTLIIVLSSLFFIPLVGSLFHPGPPVNSDIGVHYSAIKCIYDSGQWSVPTAWCAHGQAGLARFQRYGVVHAYVTLLLAMFLPFEIAFKFMMVLGFLILPIVAYFFLSRLGHPLAGAVAYALLLLEPGGQMWGGYQLHFVITGFINSMATGLSLLTIMCLLWMLEHPTPKRISTTSLVTAIYFLTHPGSALWLPIAGVPIGILYWEEIKENWKILLSYPLLFLGFISFWLIPALYKSSYFNPPGLVGFISFQTLSEGFSQLDRSQILLLIIGILCGVYTILCEMREVKLIGGILFAILVTWIFAHFLPGFFYFHYFLIDRSFYEFRTYIILATAITLTWLFPRSCPYSKRHITYICLTLITSLIVVFYFTDLPLKSQIHTGEEIEPVLIPIFHLLDHAKGRVIAENTYFDTGNKLHYTQPWALSAVYSYKEFLGNSDFWYTKDDYSLAYDRTLFYRDIRNYSSAELNDTLQKLNVQYIWVYSPFMINHLKWIYSVDWDLQQELMTGVIYKIPGDYSFISFPGGQLSQTNYQTRFASSYVESTSGGVVYFKVRAWPNWKATLDGRALAVKKGAMGLMEVEVPPGKHQIQFTYRLIWIDWIGYIITLIGLFSTGYWIYSSQLHSTLDNTNKQ